MKFNANNKGFSYSPYLLIVMMILCMLMAIHFINVDAEKAAAIAQEGKIAKNALQLEGSKSAARNVILLSAYDAIDKAFRVDLQTPSVSVEKLGLKGFIIEKILADLNNVHDPNDPTGIGAYDKVEIDEKDKDGKTRKDGFIVRAEGTHYGTPMKVEKYVDSRIFYFYDKGKTLKQNLKDELANEMKCKLGIKTTPPDQFEPDENLRCQNKEAMCFIHQSYNLPLYNSYTPGDQFFDADALTKKISESVTSLVKKTANKQAFQSFGNDDIVVKFSVDYIDANIQILLQSQSNDCCHWVTKTDSGGSCGYECVEWKKYYEMEILITGSIYIKELKLIDNAALKQKEENKYEICSKSPMMIKTGELKVMAVEQKEYSLPYEIHMVYNSGQCKPIEVKKASNAIRYWPSRIPSYVFDEKSLKYTNDNPDCNWDSGYTDVCEQLTNSNPCGCSYRISASC